MASGKRASMREGPLAALFRKTETEGLEEGVPPAAPASGAVQASPESPRAEARPPAPIVNGEGGVQNQRIAVRMARSYGLTTMTAEPTQRRRERSRMRGWLAHSPIRRRSFANVPRVTPCRQVRLTGSRLANA